MENYHTDVVLLKLLDGNIIKLGDVVPEGLVVGIKISEDYSEYALRVLNTSGNEIEVDVTSKVYVSKFRYFYTKIVHLGNNLEVKQDKHTLVFSGLRVPAVEGFLTAEDSERLYGKIEHIIEFDAHEIAEFHKAVYETTDKNLSDVITEPDFIINLIYATELDVFKLRYCITDVMVYNISNGLDWSPYDPPKLHMRLPPPMSSAFFPQYPKRKVEPVTAEKPSAFQVFKEKFNTTFFGK